MDTITTEESVLESLKTLTDNPIKELKIARDSLTNTSCGVCHVEMNTIVEAISLHNTLLSEPHVIDDKLVSVSFGRSGRRQGETEEDQAAAAASAAAAAAAVDSKKSSAADTALAAAQWSHGLCRSDSLFSLHLIQATSAYLKKN